MFAQHRRLKNRYDKKCARVRAKMFGIISVEMPNMFAQYLTPCGQTLLSISRAVRGTNSTRRGFDGRDSSKTLRRALLCTMSYYVDVMRVVAKTRYIHSIRVFV